MLARERLPAANFGLLGTVSFIGVIDSDRLERLESPLELLRRGVVMRLLALEAVSP